MAFTGVATVKQVRDNLFLITGLSLAGAASGTIGLTADGTPSEVALPGVTWGNIKNGLNQPVTLLESVEIRITIVTDVTDAVPISVVKTGATPQTFVATLHNDSAATVSAGLEIWVEFHG